MFSTDPLAHERFRTILTDALGNLDDEAPYEVAADGILSEFPHAHFEYRTNEAGARLRRVVVEGTWEVDPLPAWMDGPTRADAAPTHAHPFVPVRYKGRVEPGCGHVTMTFCHKPREDAAHLGDIRPSCPVATGPCPGDDHGVICKEPCRSADR